MVQLYAQKKSGTTEGIIKALPRLLPHVPLQTCAQIDDIKTDQPVLLLVPNSANIEEDLNITTTELKDIPADMIAILVIHVKPRRAALPKTKTIDSLEDQKYKTYGLVVDLAYHNGSFYTHQMNTEGMKCLTDFITAKSPYIENTTTDTEDGVDVLIPSPEAVIDNEGKNEVQIYLPMEPVQIIGFTNALQDSLPNFHLTLCETPECICPNKPLLILLQNIADAEEDINNAIFSLKSLLFNMVAVVVIHAHEPDNLPQSPTRDKLTDKMFNDFGLIVDFAYHNEAIYDHQMNTDGVKSLTDFIKKYSQENTELRAPAPNRYKTDYGDKTVNESMYAKGGDALLQCCHSSGMSIDNDLDGISKNLQKAANLDCQDVKVIQLSEDNPWLILCEEGDYVYKAVQEVKDMYINQKLIIIINKDAQTTIQTEGETWIEVRCAPQTTKKTDPVIQGVLQKFQTIL